MKIIICKDFSIFLGVISNKPLKREAFSSNCPPECLNEPIRLLGYYKLPIR